MNSIRWSRRKTATALALAGLASLVLGSVGATAKTTVTGAHASAPGAGTKVRSPESPTAVPKKYNIASANFSAANGVQTHGSVTCPVIAGVQTRPQGGGATIFSSSVFANVNSSYPTTNGWSADVNNVSGADTTFRVDAVCAKPHRAYAQVSASTSNPAGSQTHVSVNCPTGTKILGGGAFSNTFSTAVNINEINPTHSGSTYGWEAFMNNASGSDASMTVYAVCSKYSITRAGYTIVEGSPVTVTSPSQTPADAICPSGDVPLGGGESNNSTSRAVNLNTSFPLSNGWRTFINNNSGSSITLNSWAICAF